MRTETELALMIEELTAGKYDIAELKKDVVNKIRGTENSGSLVEKIRLKTGDKLITNPRFMILFMRYWDSVDRELKEGSSVD